MPRSRPTTNSPRAARARPRLQQLSAAARDRAALSAALDPIITIDSRGTILSASDSMRRVLGWCPSELVDRNINILMPEPHHSAHDGYLAKYLRTGQTSILNRPRRFEALRKDGSPVPIELCVSRAEVPGGGSPLFVGIIRDMSALVAAERSREQERSNSRQQLAEQTSALHQANVRLRMSDRMASIGTLAAGLGHDMNNVLLPVRARLNAIKASGGAGTISVSVRRHVDEIQKSVSYLQQLADGLHLLTMDPETRGNSGAGGGRTDLKLWWAQAGPLLSSAVPKHVRLSAEFDRVLPPAKIAAHGLTQAVLNLVVNAGESIPSPRVRKRRQGHVRLSARAVHDSEGAWLQLNVSDNGTGMTEEVKRRAFEMFFTTKPRGMGTGLGLPLVRRVVDRAGGRIEIDSEWGRGTTVRLFVPATGRSGPVGRESRSLPLAVISIAKGRARGLVRQVLEASGARARTADRPARADIWIVEPRAERLSQARQWRKRNPSGRLVLFGQPEPAVRREWQSLESIPIQSPDDFEAVRAAIARALSTH